MTETMLEPILINDIGDYKQPNGLKYSPDGKTLAFHVQSADVEKNCYHHDVYVYRNGEVKQVTYSLDATVVGFEDSTHLVIRRKNDELLPNETQLYLLDLNGGEAKPWMVLPFGMRSFRKVSDGVYAVTGMIDGNDPDAYLERREVRKEKLEAKKKDSDYTVVDEIPYWFNGAGYTNKMRTALFLVKTGEEVSVKRVTGADFNTGAVEVHAGKVYFAGNDVGLCAPLKDKLFVFNTETEEMSALYEKDTHSVSRIMFVNDTMYVAASDGAKYGLNQTADICRFTGEGFEIVYVPEVSLYSSVIGDTAEGDVGAEVNRNRFVTLATVDEHNAIFEFDEEFHKTTIWEQPGMLCSMTVSDEQIAVVFQDWNNVSEVYVMNRDGSGMEQITSLNDEALKGKYIAKPNPIYYHSEGYDLKGWVLLPQNFDPEKKYPAVLDVHGGPRTAYGETFFHEMQVWASKGYVVFFTNIKGSDGRGDAFADIRGDYGGTDFRNLMDFTDAVLEAYPNIDTAKLCETGGSYGGYMTNWIIGHTDRFCACASQRSISNWISFSYIADIGYYFGPDQNGADSPLGEENYLKMWEHSPLKYAENVTTPTLFIHSDEDFRCPLPEGMQMMQALAYRNIETRMCIFHGENHELSRSGLPQHRIRRLNEITNWFDQHTK